MNNQIVASQWNRINIMRESTRLRANFTFVMDICYGTWGCHSIFTECGLRIIGQHHIGRSNPIVSNQTTCVMEICTTRTVLLLYYGKQYKIIIVVLLIVVIIHIMTTSKTKNFILYNTIQ